MHMDAPDFPDDVRRAAAADPDKIVILHPGRVAAGVEGARAVGRTVADLDAVLLAGWLVAMADQFPRWDVVRPDETPAPGPVAGIVALTEDDRFVFAGLPTSDAICDGGWLPEMRPASNAAVVLETEKMDAHVDMAVDTAVDLAADAGLAAAAAYGGGLLI